MHFCAHQLNFGLISVNLYQTKTKADCFPNMNTLIRKTEAKILNYFLIETNIKFILIKSMKT